jgi:flagellar biosynthesis/type III secretory pathway protein FliH
MLLYAIHSDSDLDTKKIYHSLASNPELRNNAMSLAEKLLTKGRVEGLEKGIKKGRSEGIEKGYWLGRIQSLEEFLEETKSSRAALESMSIAELEARHQQLHGEYQWRFK